MTLTIRRATAHDAAALTVLMQASSAYGGDYRSMLDGYEITAEQIRTEAIYLAERGGKLLGFYALLLNTPKPELDLMFVDDAAQGQGIGACLFAHMRHTALSHGVRELKIVSHPPAEAFYTRMGATRVGELPAGGHVTWPRPVMALKLAQSISGRTLISTSPSVTS